MTDAEWESHIRARADTVYHPVGTCKMGIDDMRWSIRKCACAASRGCAS